MSHGPIDPAYVDLMNFLAKAIDESFNGKDCKPEERTVGFCLLMFPFGSDPKNRMNYISNADKKDMLCALKEYVARLEGRVLETPTPQ